MRHLNNGTDHRHSKSSCDQSSPARRTITRLTIVYSTVYSDADQRKHQSSASLAFVRGIHRGPVNSPNKWSVTRKMFPFGDVIMIWTNYSLLLFGSLGTIFSCDQAALWMVQSVRLSVRPSVRLSVCQSHLFEYVPIILSSWNFQELLPVTKVTSMQKVKVRGQRSRSQRSRPNLTVSGL